MKMMFGSNVFHEEGETIGGFCSRTSSMIKPFLLVDEWARRITKKSLFDSEDMGSILKGEISVKNLTIATYMRLGTNTKERDELLAHLCRAAGHTVVVGTGGESSVLVKLPELIKGVGSVEVYSEETYDGTAKRKRLPSGLLMSANSDSNGHVYCKVLVYSKDQEVAVKEETRNVIAARRVPDLNEFIRVDATLNNDMLEPMMAALFGKSESNLTVAGLDRVLQKPSLLLAISRSVITKTRLPLLLRAPSLEDIDRAARSEPSVKEWMRSSRTLGVNLEKNGVVKMEWEKVKDEEGAERVLAEFGIDMRVPFRFYLELNLIRVLGRLTAKESTRFTEGILRGSVDKPLLERVRRESKKFLSTVTSDLTKLPMSPPSRIGSRMIRPYLVSLLKD